MVEWILSGIARLFVWLWTSGMTLYYLAGFFIVVGGLIIFVVSIAHHYWKRSSDQRIAAVSFGEPRVIVHIGNMTLEVTEPQLRSLLAERELTALPTGFGVDDQYARR